MDFLVNIMNRRTEIRARTLSDDVRAMVQMSLKEALETRWESPAHFVTYSLFSADGEEPCPPLTNQAVRELRKEGGELFQRILVWDLDRDPHEPWESPEQAKEALQEVIKQVDPTVAYTTKRGLRILLALSEGVTLDAARKLHEKLTPDIEAALREVPVEVDRSSKESLRCFKLPFTSEFSDAILHINPSVVYEITDTWKECALARLQGRPVHNFIKHPGSVPVPPHGSRHTEMVSLAGSAVSMLRGLPGTTEEKIVKLFEPWLERFPEDEADEPPKEHFTKIVEGLFQSEVARFGEPPEITIPSGEDPTVAFLNNLRNIYGNKVPDNDSDLWGWAVQHAVLIHSTRGGQLYVLGPDGYYAKQACEKPYLKVHLKQFGMPGLVDEDNLTVQQIVESHGYLIGDIRKEGIKKGGGILRDGNLVFPVDSLRELTPRYDPNVDKWLRLMFGDAYPDVERWIWGALSVEYEIPLCALFMAGPPSTGKKLFQMGLVECFESGKFATESVLSNFQAGLDESCILLINEGLDNETQKDPGIALRKYLGGDTIEVNRKFKAPVKVKNLLRTVIATNDFYMLYSFVGKQMQSVDDRKAILKRFLAVSINKEAAEFLEELGGINFTGAEGERWIASDGSEAKSEFIVARHFFWIKKFCDELGYKPGPRFLVEGKISEEAEDIYRLEVGRSSEVGEILLRFVEETLPLKGVAFEDNQMFVTTRAVKNQATNLSQGMVTKALRMLSDGPQEYRRIGGVVGRWWPIKMQLLWVLVDGDPSYPRLKSMIGEMDELPEDIEDGIEDMFEE